MKLEYEHYKGKMPMSLKRDGQQSRIHVFWGEIPPSEHFVQIYEDDGVVMDALEGFIGGGLRAGDGVLVLATVAHLQALEDRLTAQGLDVGAAQEQEQYIPLDAEDILTQFMVRGWPDDDRFEHLVTDLLARARRNRRQVRAFGEMVALLWAQGHNGATVRLEHLWHKICQKEGLSLFCAYPRIGFTQDADASIRDICAAHDKVVAGYAVN
jgi:hypothetical protein